MTTPVNVIPFSVDYTNRDFFALREALIARVKNRVPEWYGNDANDFGVALIEAFSYMGDVVNYYTDRVANENFLETATQRSSILALARNYGYLPAGYRSASLSVSFTNASTTADLVVPAGTQLRGSVSVGDSVYQVIFTTTEDALVLRTTDSVSPPTIITATHGEQVALRTASGYSSDGELLGYSTGTPAQSYVLKENQVVDNSVEVFVKSGNVYEPWVYVSNLTDFGPNDAVFTLNTDDENYVSVVFGDGVSGAIPPLHFELRAKYVVGGGVVGNIPELTSLTVYRLPTGTLTSVVEAVVGNITAITTTVGVGGGDPESIESIRALAPRAFSALNRAVTLRDYSTLALLSSEVGKANAVADIWSSVTVYAAPLVEDTSTDPYPLFDETNTTLSSVIWTGFKASVEESLFQKTQIGVTVTVAPPNYVPVNIKIRYTLAPGAIQSRVEADIRTSMEFYWSYSARRFEETIHPEDIENILWYTAGLTNVRVEELYREGESASRRVLVGSPSEIFMFNTVTSAPASRTEIVAYGANPALSALLVGASAVSGFNAELFNYALSVSASSVTITPTLSDPNGTLTVNGTVVESGTASGSISLGSIGDVTTVVITTTAENKVTSSTYRLTITRT
jgi:hypothetical protein